MTKTKAVKKWRRRPEDSSTGRTYYILLHSVQKRLLAEAEQNAAAAATATVDTKVDEPAPAIVDTPPCVAQPITKKSSKVCVIL